MMKSNREYWFYGILIFVLLAVVVVVFSSGAQDKWGKGVRRRREERREGSAQDSDKRDWKIISFEATRVNSHCRGYQLADYVDGRVFFYPYRYTFKKTRITADDANPSGWFLAYDVSQPFTETASWKTVDLSSLVDPAAEGFLGGFPDNKGHIYFVPYEKDTGDGKKPSDLFVRYNTAKQIDDPNAYETHHLGIKDKGWASGVSDGRYAYYCPVNNVIRPHFSAHGLMVRYDSQQPFDHTAAWSTVDLAEHHPKCVGYQSTGFDGRYVYFAPFIKTRLVRYDTTKDFNIRAKGAFESVDLTGPKFGGRHAKIYTGVVVAPIPGSSSGKYVYLVPWGIPKLDVYVSTVARFDGRKSLDNPAAWQFFDISTLNSSAKGYQFGWYDDTYVYFVSTYNGNNPPPFVRHDPTKSLNESGSWFFFDPPQSYPPSTGAAFDGNFAYTVPYGNHGARGTIYRLYCSQ